jgi:hypothetical protein
VVGNEEGTTVGDPRLPAGRRFRVEHRHQGTTHALGRVEDGFAHFSALDPYLAHLPPDATGQIVLVDEATGEVVARRYLSTLRRGPNLRKPPSRPPRDADRPPRP